MQTWGAGQSAGTSQNLAHLAAMLDIAKHAEPRSHCTLVEQGWPMDAVITGSGLQPTTRLGDSQNGVHCSVAAHPVWAVSWQRTITSLGAPTSIAPPSVEPPASLAPLSGDGT